MAIFKLLGSTNVASQPLRKLEFWVPRKRRKFPVEARTPSMLASSAGVLLGKPNSDVQPVNPRGGTGESGHDAAGIGGGSGGTNPSASHAWKPV